MYIKRQIENYVLKVSQTFPVIMLTGPRQAGKTTLLRNLVPQRRFVTLDDLEVRSLAQNDPKIFLEQYPPPVTIDEFHYAPQILPYIKMLIDEKRTQLKKANGYYWLTGSQHFNMMQNVQESLAGRVAILNLLGFSRNELESNVTPAKNFITDKIPRFETMKTQKDIFHFILRGDKPELWSHKTIEKELYYRSYVQTYIERDVMSQMKIKDIGLFEKFLRILASRSGQILNLTSLSSELGISAPTVKLWITLLERTYQIVLLPSYFQNIGKRSLKTPKIYFLDTGLICYLLKILNEKEAFSSYLAGSLFENWVVEEIIKSYWYNGKSANLYYWRTKEGTEVDLVYYAAGKLYPVEIKLTASPKKALFRSFEKLARQAGIPLGRRKIICSSKFNSPLNKTTDMVSALSIA